MYNPITLLSLFCSCDYELITQLVGQLFDGNTFAITWCFISPGKFKLTRDIQGSYIATFDNQIIQIWANEQHKGAARKWERTFYEKEFNLVLEESSTSARCALFRTISTILEKENWKISWKGSNQQEFLLQKKSDTIEIIQWRGKDIKRCYFSANGDII